MDNYIKKLLNSGRLYVSDSSRIKQSNYDEDEFIKRGD